MALVPNPTTGKLDLIPAPANVQLGKITGEPMGFQDNVSSAWTVEYDATTRTITLTPNGTQYVYVKGKRFAFSAPTSLAHADVTAEYFFYFDVTGTLQVSTTPFDYKNTAHVAYVDYDTAQTPKGYALTENHGVVMDKDTHARIHKNPGTIRESGGALTAGTYVVKAPTDTYNAANSALADIQPGVAATVILDEDKQHTLASLVEATGYTTMRKDWTNSRWIWATAQTAPYYHTANVPQYNPSSGGANLAALTATAYFCTYLMGIPATDDAGSQVFRYVWIPGQAQYVPTDASAATRTLARNAALAEDPNVSLDLTGLPATEYVLLGKLVLVYDTGNTGNDYRLRIGGYQQLTGSRTATGAISGASAQIHNNLDNRDAPAAHPASAIAVTPVGGIVATDAQAALAELDADLSAHVVDTTAFHGTTGLASSKPPAVTSSTSGTVGVSTKLAREDHGHDLGAHNHTNAAGGGQLTDAALSAAVTYQKGGTGLTALGTALQVLRTNAGATAIEWGAGGGDVVGPATATTNTIPLFNDTTGKLLKGTGIVVTSDKILGSNITGPINGGATGGALASTAVGYKVVSVITSTVVATTDTVVTLDTNIQLSAGRWRLYYSVTANYFTGASTSDRGQVEIWINETSTATSVIVGKSKRRLYAKTVAATNNDLVATLAAEEIIDVTSGTKTYRLIAKRTDTSAVSGTPAATITEDSIFFAVRID